MGRVGWTTTFIEVVVADRRLFALVAGVIGEGIRDDMTSNFQRRKCTIHADGSYQSIGDEERVHLQLQALQIR